MASILNGLDAFFESSSDTNMTDLECSTSINHYKFYQFSLIPSVIITVLLAITTKRRRLMLNVFEGKTGLLYPMNSLTRSSRLSYAAAFGSTALLVYQILIDQQFAVNYDGAVAIKTLIAIASMLIYGSVFFPVFACLALKTAFSYGLGSLLVWMFSAIDFYQAFECNYNATGRAIIIVRNLPSLVCHLYLSISIPARFVQALRNKSYIEYNQSTSKRPLTLSHVKQSYRGKYVKELLAFKEVKESPDKRNTGLLGTVKTFFERWIYVNEPGFRYPSRILSVMITAAIVVYVISVEYLVLFTTILDMIVDTLNLYLEEANYELDYGQGSMEYRDGLQFAIFLGKIMKICLVVSTALAFVCSFITILHMLSSFRMNLHAMYRGDYRHIPSPSEHDAASLCVGSIKYAGFQVAYIVWSFILTFLVLFIICFILAVIITLLQEGITDWLVDIVLQLWPGLLMTIILLVVQKLLAKKVFLQENGRHLRLDNRRIFFIFTYFMFFYNIFLGFVSCLLRIIKAMGVGIIFLARLDNSTLPRRFEFFDPGFSAYKGFIHMEAAHTHPVVIVFIQLLQAMKSERKQLDKDSSSQSEDVKNNDVTSSETMDRDDVIVTVDETGDGDNANKQIENRDVNEIDRGRTTDSTDSGNHDTCVNSNPVSENRKSEQPWGKVDFGAIWRKVALERHKTTPKRDNFPPRFNWWLAYTLLHNPQIRIYRRGFIQAMEKAKREGIRVPISDKPISDFDLVQITMERDKQKEEEGAKREEEQKARKLEVQSAYQNGTSGFSVKNMIAQHHGVNSQEDCENANNNNKNDLNKRSWFLRKKKKKNKDLPETDCDENRENFQFINLSVISNNDMAKGNDNVNNNHNNNVDDDVGNSNDDNNDNQTNFPLY